MLRAVLELLAPTRCVACGRRAELPWCGPCGRRAEQLVAARACGRCGAHRGRGGAHGCWRGPPPVVALHAAYRYRDVIADTVVNAKVEGIWAAWRPLGLRLAACVSEDDAAGSLRAVTWVPTEPGRRRRRGVDHAHRLAAGVAAGLGLPLVATLRARPGLPDQARRSEHERARLPDDAFSPRCRPPGGHLLLVDDVVTTGATLSAAAGALREAGAEVAAAVLARAGDRPLRAPDRTSRHP